MTILPEAKLAREAEIAYACVSLPTDYDCWKPHPRNAAGTAPQELLREIIGNLQSATQRSIALIKAALADLSIVRDTPSPAHDALKLAIWSDKSKISEAEMQRLWPLWGKHLVGG
jgi:5'-methylthioadenosine phosphorylase